MDACSLYVRTSVNYKKQKCSEIRRISWSGEYSRIIWSFLAWFRFFVFLSPALIFPSQVVNCLLSYHNYFDAAQVGVLRMHFQSDIRRMQAKKFAIFITKLIVLFLNVIRTTSHWRHIFQKHLRSIWKNKTSLWKAGTVETSCLRMDNSLSFWMRNLRSKSHCVMLPNVMPPEKMR